MIRRQFAGIDGYQGFAGAVTVGAVGGNEVIKVKVDFRSRVSPSPSRPVSDEPGFRCSSDHPYRRE